MIKRVLLAMAISSLVGLSLLLVSKPESASAAANVPKGFEDEEVLTSIDSPIALAFTPDGRLLITTKSGRLLIRDDETSSTTPALDISDKICSNSERGLLGVAVDPAFATNGYVYLYYTYNKHRVCPEHKPASNINPVNRVSRFTMVGDTIDKDSERVLLDNIPSPNGNHNAGDLHFGQGDQERHLYVSVGDGSCDYAEPKNCQYENDASRDRHALLGKILRVGINPDPAGTTFIPPDNPYTGPDSRRCDEKGFIKRGKKCQEIFALGLRNPFRMAFDPDAAGTSFRINDVGGAHREEIDVGKHGADYAWNLCEGRRDNPDRRGSVKCGQPPYTSPIHEYSHSAGCRSITGGAFVPDGAWPGYDDAYLFGDFICGKIFSLEPKQGGGFARTEFVAGLRGNSPGPVTMTFGRYGTGQALYYTTFAGGGEVRRIVYTGT